MTGRGRGLGKVCAGIAAAAALAATAVAQDRAVELVTTGPEGSGSLSEFEAVTASDDGATVAFSTSERLVSADGDDQPDVYVRRGGTTTLASRGEKNGDLPVPATAPVVSQDGSRVYFTTAEALVAEDSDGMVDVYEWIDGSTRLVSVRDPNAPGDAADVTLASRLPAPAGDRLILETTEKLLSADGDAARDLYERTAGGIRLLTGATDADAIPLDANRSLTHVFFETAKDLLASDGDGNQPDTYMVHGDQLAHVSRAHAANVGAAGVRTWADLVSTDGSRAFLITPLGLDAGDTDETWDTYLWQADGSVTWISKQAGGVACPSCNPNTYGASADLSLLAFTTRERLVPGDLDQAMDVYTWSAGTLALVSTGPTGGNAAADVSESIGGRSHKVSSDGRGVLFTTGESLVAEDTDAAVDLYERIDGATRLVSTGEIGANGGALAGTGTYRAGSARVVFASATALSRGDTDEQLDVYLREAGATRLISVGRAAYDAEFVGAAADAGRIFFRTREQLAAEDLDGGRDLYASRQLPVPAGGGGPAADTTPPELGLRVTRRTFRTANRRARISRRKRRTPVGTLLDVYVNEGGQVNMTFSKLVPGRRSKGRCVRAKRRVRRSLRCTKPVSQRGKLTFPVRGGRNRVRFYGKVGGRRLKPGRYAVFARAYDGAGNRSRIVNARFRIKSR